VDNLIASETVSICPFSPLSEALKHVVKFFASALENRLSSVPDAIHWLTGHYSLRHPNIVTPAQGQHQKCSGYQLDIRPLRSYEPKRSQEAVVSVRVVFHSDCTVSISWLSGPLH